MFSAMLSTGDDKLATFLLGNRFPHAHIPDYGSSRVSGSRLLAPDFVVEHKCGPDRISVSLTDRSCSVFADAPNPQEFTYVALALLEKARSANSEYTLHASAMAKDGEAILFLGDRGAGKSTMCQELGSRGWEYVSDEHTVLRESSIVAGSTVSVPREGEIIAKNGPRDIGVKLVAIPKLSNRETLFTEQWDPWLSNLKLYEEASKLIRGLGIRLGSATMGSLDDQPTADNRLKWAKNFASKVPFVFVEGTKSMIGDYICMMRWG